MANLTVQQVKPVSALVPAYAAASAGGDVLVDGGGAPWGSLMRTLLHVKNTGGSPTTVTLRLRARIGPGGRDVASYVVPAGAERWCGPVPTAPYEPWVGPGPVLSAVAGGALVFRSYAVAVGYVKGGSLYAQGVPGGGTLAANTLLKVTSPTAVAEYDGWVPLIGTNLYALVFQPGHPATPVAWGTDWTEPVGGATLTGSIAVSVADPVQAVLVYSGVSGVSLAAFDVQAGIGP